MRRSTLFEGASAIVFTGVLAHQVALSAVGARAVEELAARGYAPPTRGAPVVVSAVQRPALHAGEWTPGNIKLVANPTSDFSVDVYLRHELMHEVNYRTCGPDFPVWANEAAAVAFSGEARDRPLLPQTPGELESLAKAVRLRSPLSAAHLRTLTALVAEFGWPATPCERSQEIQRVIESGATGASPGGISYVLMHAVSGRVFEASHDAAQREPLGSVMKLPYVASLGDGALGAAEALVPSDTQKLEALSNRLDRDLYYRIIEASGQRVSYEASVGTLLGERDVKGDFPYTFSLFEAARLVRASVFMQPRAFLSLADQVTRRDATLARSSSEFKSLMEQLGAGAKTGTVSDARGEPVMGHLVILWPASQPEVIAVFRKAGVRGAALSEAAIPFLREWRKRYRFAAKTIRVQLMSALPRQAWTLEVADDACVPLSRAGNAGAVQMSGCGVWRISTAAKRAREIRYVRGIVENGTLSTDLETYVDAVSSAEGDNLKKEALRALRVVIAANALRGGSYRHPVGQQAGALCDTTHCMVFLGTKDTRVRSGGDGADPAGLEYLFSLPGGEGRAWYPFSLGGDAEWGRTLSTASLAQFAGEPVILDLRRERMRDGTVRIRLTYPEGEEIIPCDTLMLQFNLPACPDRIRASPEGFELRGQGRGHEEGFSLMRANYLAGQGQTMVGILQDAFADGGLR